MNAVGVLITQILRIAAPYLFAAGGGLLAEEAGVVSLGLEGYMLGGACAAAFAAVAFHAAWAGIVGALLAGAALGALHATVSVGFGGDQIISGLAINILAVGATEFALRVGFGSASNSPRTPGIAGTLVDPLLLGAILSVPLVGLVISRTVYGLRVRAVGGNAAAATAAGVPVGRVQGTAVIWSGAIAALGGAYLTLDQHQFTDQMTAGRGFIALAAIVFGRRRPVATAAACLLFAAGETLEIHLAARAGMPSQIIGTLPYVVGLGVLVVGRAGARGGL